MRCRRLWLVKFTTSIRLEHQPAQRFEPRLVPLRLVPTCYCRKQDSVIQARTFRSGPFSFPRLRRGIAYWAADCEGVAQTQLVQKTVLSFGETLWDLLPSGPVLGGAPFNFAYRINSLGDRGFIVSRLGRDGYGRKALDQLTALGMDASHLQLDNHHPTGTVQVSLDEKRNPEFFIVPEVAYDFIEVTC